MTLGTDRETAGLADPGPWPYRVIQIHPSLRCNLSCRHCYSSSGPSRTETLPRELVETLVVDAAAQGYDAISVSGGEPLMWPGLRDTLALAKACGLATALTTNLIPLTLRRLDGLERVLDAIAISLDGMPPSHDRIRGKRGAFTGMTRRLPALRAARIPFGFIFTLTEANLHELPWVARFAIEQGAKLLQIHPLEEVGRAATALRGQRPGELAANAAYLAVVRLRDRVGDSIEIRLDFAHRAALREEPWRGWSEAPVDGEAIRLADLVSPLVVETDGTVVPLQHGFPRRHALGNLKDAPLGVLANHWRRGGGYARFRAECEAALQWETADRDALPAFNWFEAVSAWLGEAGPAASGERAGVTAKQPRRSGPVRTAMSSLMGAQPEWRPRTAPRKARSSVTS
jgi:MoaA/NifB/PqqE/SkfB family radical SAM enzyme